MRVFVCSLFVHDERVGGSVYKGFNRAVATASAGLIALGVNWVASKSGDKLEPFITSGSLFLLGMFFLIR
jgi:hypothetical protein